MVTVAPLTEQAVEIEENVTGLPDAPPVAETANAASPYILPERAANVIVWGVRAITLSVPMAVSVNGPDVAATTAKLELPAGVVPPFVVSTSAEAFVLDALVRVTLPGAPLAPPSKEKVTPVGSPVTVSDTGVEPV